MTHAPTHAQAAYPHAGACAECRAERRCNYCGEKWIVTRPGSINDNHCTNGRCFSCHQTVCTEGGAITLGHAFGTVGRDWRDR
jgi:hypothetical protein